MASGYSASETTDVDLGVWLPVADRPDLRRIERIRLTVTAFSFVDGTTEQRYVIFQHGPVTNGATVRIESACFGQAVGLLRCDCQDQINLALEVVGRAPNSLLVYAFDQDGRGNGPVEHVNAIKRMDELGVPLRDVYPMGDQRSYRDMAVILKEVLGLTAVRLLTNNPHRLHELQQTGLNVERLPFEPSVRDEDRQVLEWKRDLEGHTLVLDGLSHVGRPA